MQPTLLILAAGMASRYGSMKQIQGFGPHQETIMDYSIYDAIRAGFGKVVFIIREEFAEDFKSIFEPKLAGKIATAYVFQETHSFMDGIPVPANRKKPWGTGHAVLCAMQLVKEPFAVINADDFYGRDGFAKAASFLKNDCTEKLYAIIGYELAKTLSEHGTVSRGVCEVDKTGHLVSIHERTKIYKSGPEDTGHAGMIIYEDENGKHTVARDSSVSMNFWCFHPSFFVTAHQLFQQFVKENLDHPTAEFFIPIIAANFIEEGGGIKVIPCSSQWFGVTYKEDAQGVKQSIDTLIEDGAYQKDLWK